LFNKINLNLKSNLSLQEQGELTNEKDKIRVVVRIRPPSDNERIQGDSEIISCDKNYLIVSTS